MDFKSRVVNRRKQRIHTASSYTSSLQFYTDPPTGEIALKDFDALAVERLKILRSIERVNLSGQARNSDEWMNKLYDDFTKNKYFITLTEKVSDSKIEEIISARKRDHDSHFILRLAYCRTEELRRWFVTQETDLFRARFMRASSNGTDFTPFLNFNNLHFKMVCEEELQKQSLNLVAGTYNLASIDQLESKAFFKVPFIEALELVRSRKVFIQGGFAFVPSSDLVTLVATVFRTRLSHSLAFTCRALSQIDDDERLVKLLQDFDKRYTGSDYSQKKSGSGQQITPDMINQLSNKSFPLCMRNMQDTLRSQHTLKHGGRMQYSLFLKAAGLSLDDALQFWRSHFTKIMDVDKFEKQYAYNIRHNYGKEGKRTDYTPYSCMKIITSSVGPGDAHGCPFKHLDSNILLQKLNNFRISQQAITEVMELVKGNHYQIACQRYFEAQHNSIVESGINHPNQYFEESMMLLHGSKTPNKGSNNSQIKTHQTIMMSQPQSSQNSTQELSKAEISGIDDLDDTIFEDMEIE